MQNTVYYIFLKITKLHENDKLRKIQPLQMNSSLAGHIINSLFTHSFTHTLFLSVCVHAMCPYTARVNNCPRDLSTEIIRKDICLNTSTIMTRAVVDKGLLRDKTEINAHVYIWINIAERVMRGLEMNYLDAFGGLIDAYRQLNLIFRTI